MTESSALFEKVDAVTVPVPDLDAGLRFYAEALGHRLNWRNDEIGQAGLQLPGGDTELVVATDLRYEPNWLVDSADAAAERFRAAGGRIVTWALEPATPSLDRFRELMLDLQRQRGKSVDHVARQCALIAQAGFERTHAGASCVTNGTADAVRRAAGAYRQLLHDPEFAAIAGDEVTRLDDELRTWAERPDAFELLLWRSIVARKTDEARG